MYMDLMPAMDIYEIRKRNLRALIDKEFGGVSAALARRMNKADNVIQRIFSKSEKAHRDVGKNLARDIEVAAGKPRGWLDQEFHFEEMPRLPYEDPIGMLARSLLTQPPEKILKVKEMLRIMDVNIDIPVDVIGVPRDALIITDLKEREIIETYRSASSYGKQMIEAGAAAAREINAVIENQSNESEEKKKQAG